MGRGHKKISYLRRCHRCNTIYTAKTQHSKVCEKCCKKKGRK